MRGKIIMWNGEKGVITALDQRYDFTITNWQGNVAPKPDMVVLLTMEDGRLSAVNPVPEADLVKERMSQVGEKGSAIAQGIYENVGKDVVIGYAAFAVCALSFSVVSGKGIYAAVSFTLANLLSILNNLNLTEMLSDGFKASSGHGVLMVLLSAATIVVPYFWKNRYAPLAFCTPLLLVLYTSVKVYQIYHTAMESAKALLGDDVMQSMQQYATNLGSQMQAAHQVQQPLTNDISISLFAYILIAIALYLASRGVVRYLKG